MPLKAFRPESTAFDPDHLNDIIEWTDKASHEIGVVVVVVVFLTLTDPLRIQLWSQDRRNQTKSNRESEISMESRQKRTDKEVASKEHRRDKIENINKNTQTVETN